jgi:hypothetical protein
MVQVGGIREVDQAEALVRLLWTTDHLSRDHRPVLQGHIISFNQRAVTFWLQPWDLLSFLHQKLPDWFGRQAYIRGGSVAESAERVPSVDGEFVILEVEVVRAIDGGLKQDLAGLNLHKSLIHLILPPHHFVQLHFVILIMETAIWIGGFFTLLTLAHISQQFEWTELLDFLLGTFGSEFDLSEELHSAHEGERVKESFL